VSHVDDVWRPEEGFDHLRDVGVMESTRQTTVASYAAQLARSKDHGDELSTQLEQAIRDLWEAEDEAVAAVHRSNGRVPGPEVDTEAATKAGIDADMIRRLREGVRFTVEEVPDQHATKNYGSVRDNLLRYILEITRLLRKYKLLPVKRQPWLLEECGFVVTQEGKKVRLVVDATATGLNERLRVALFRLPTIERMLELGHEGDSLRKDDVTDMFLSIRLHPSQYTLCGIANELTGQLYVYPWVSFGVAEAPLIAHQVMSAVQAAADPELEQQSLKPTAGDVALVDEPTKNLIASHVASTLHTGQEYDDEVPALMVWRDDRLRTLAKSAITGLIDSINADLRARSLDANVTYVDDLMFEGRGRDLDAAAAIIRSKLRVCGLDFKEVKTERGDRLVFIGVGADPSSLQLYVEQKKLPPLREQLAGLLAVRKTTGRVRMDVVRRVVGQLSFSSVAFSAGHTYLRRMWDAIEAVPLEHRRRGSRHEFTPTDDFWDDVSWWHKALEHPAPRRITPRFGSGRLGFWRGEPATADVVLATDASEFAWGYVIYRMGFLPLDLVTDVPLADVEAGVLGTDRSSTYGIQLPPPQPVTPPAPTAGVAHASSLDAAFRDAALTRLRAARVSADRGRRYRGGWRGDTVSLSINWKELRTVLTSCRRHGAEWRGKRVLLRVDNKAALSYVNRGYGRVRQLTKIGRQIQALASRHGFQLHAVYVNTKWNVIPDGLSRLTVGVSSPDWRFDPTEFAALQREFGELDADMMSAVDGSNALLPRFYSEANDAFSVPLDGTTTWWNPPWDLVRTVLRHLANCRAGCVPHSHQHLRGTRDSRTCALSTATIPDRAASMLHAPGQPVHDPWRSDPLFSQSESEYSDLPEALVVLPQRAWDEAGRGLQRAFTVVRRYPAGTSLFSAPSYPTDDRLADDAAPDSHYTSSASPPVTRWTPKPTRFATVVVATRGLARRHGYLAVALRPGLRQSPAVA
jgi:hypothetical protein